MFALVLILITTVAIISEVQFSVITKNVNIPGKKTKKGFKLKIIKMIIDGMCIKIKIKRNKCFDWLFQNSVVCTNLDISISIFKLIVLFISACSSSYHLQIMSIYGQV